VSTVLNKSAYRVVCGEQLAELSRAVTVVVVTTCRQVLIASPVGLELIYT
jgi:hypothetical protein